MVQETQLQKNLQESSPTKCPPLADFWYIMGDEGWSQNFIRIVCVVSEKKTNTFFGGQLPLAVHPLQPQFFFNVVNKLWYIMGDEGCR